MKRVRLEDDSDEIKVPDIAAGGGAMRWAKLEPLILVLLLFPAFAFAAKDPSDYKLKVAILSDNLRSYQPFFTGGFPYFRYRVDGRGNVADGPTLHAFDFQYDSTMRVLVTFGKETYLAKWKQPQHEIELLIPNAGKEGKNETIDLQTNILEGVYVRTSQGLIPMSQADYQARQAGEEAVRAAPAPAQHAIASNLSITSQPHGAEIDVDGELMGTTPSILRLNVGPHTITLTKAGYKPWQRKMVLVTGRITLHGDLDRAN
jgi:hypothetical protein